MDLSGTVVIPGQVIPPVDDAKIIPGAGVVQSDGMPGRCNIERVHFNGCAQNVR